jgi:transitional endoplasmic reticulum ATPase
MDGLKTRGQVVVIAATNLPDIIDPALRRGGRFDREIEIGIPDTKGRQQIFQIHTRGMPLADDVDLNEYARSTHGFVGADIALLAKEAAMHALRRVIPHIKIEEEIPTEIIDELRVTNEDFIEAHKHVEPSAMREVLVEIPDVKWEDVGGLEDVKAELAEAVEWPLKHPEIFDALETEPPRGILLFGPPGTGKTLLAKAVANESESNFISVKGPELLSKWVGESERGVRQVFRKARQAAPSIIFFDEIDALMPKRGSYIGSSHVTESVVSQILTELDGLEELTNVVVLGATNRPDMLDDALLRPGRLDRMIYVPPPDPEGRKKIFEVYLRNRKILANDVNIDELVEETEGYVGADIEALVREAKISAMREFIAKTAQESEEKRRQLVGNVMVTKKHFEDALSRVRGSLDIDRLEEAERHSWQILYNQEQRSALEDAISVVNRARMRETGKTEQEVKDLMQALKDAVYQRKKDFGEIRRLTKELKTRMERPLPQTGMAF